MKTECVLLCFTIPCLYLQLSVGHNWPQANAVIALLPVTVKKLQFFSKFALAGNCCKIVTKLKILPRHWNHESAKLTNSVDYRILISLLGKCRDNRRILGWISAVLMERLMALWIGSWTSELMPVYLGLPQGSPLSTMYNIYTAIVAQIASRWKDTHICRWYSLFLSIVEQVDRTTGYV